MIKSTLKQYLEEKGCVEKGILVSSLLLKEIEVCGFLNGVKNFHHTDDKFLNRYNSILNKAPYRMLVRSGLVHQVFEYYDGCQVSAMNCTFKIYTSIAIYGNTYEVELKDLHVPAFEKSSIYNDIRRGFKKPMTEEKLRKNGFPDFIKIKDGVVTCEIEAGKILCLNKKKEVRALGEDIQVLCRYIHAETGTMCYTLYSLDELYI